MINGYIWSGGYIKWIIGSLFGRFKCTVTNVFREKTVNLLSKVFVEASTKAFDACENQFNVEIKKLNVGIKKLNVDIKKSNAKIKKFNGNPSELID